MKLLVISHGKLAEILVATAQKILGKKVSNAHTLCLKWDAKQKAMEETTRKAIAKARGKEKSPLLILTDLFGGTPTNLAMPWHKPGEVEILTGASLPMVVKAMDLVQKGKEDLQKVVKLTKRRGVDALVSSVDLDSHA